MIYVLYSAPYDLPAAFAGPDYYAALQRDPDACRIFENTVTRTLRCTQKMSRSD